MPRRTILAAVLAAAIGAGAALQLAGCSPEADDAALSSGLGQAQTGFADRHPHKLLKKLLGAIDLRAEQRSAIERLMKDLERRLAPAHDRLRAEIAREAARQVRSGIVDRARLEILFRRAESEQQAARPVVLAALNQLHRTLNAAQRRQLALELEDSLPPGGGRRHFRALRRVAKQLQLSDGQIDQIHAVVRASLGRASTHVARMMRRHDQLEEAMRAFVAEGFDANKLAIVKEGPLQQREHFERIVQLAKDILPLLTPAQRGLAAGLIEKHALH